MAYFPALDRLYGQQKNYKIKIQNFNFHDFQFCCSPCSWSKKIQAILYPKNLYEKLFKFVLTSIQVVLYLLTL